MSDPSSNNPYAPPASAESEWAPAAPPAASPVYTGVPKVFGTLSIIFASIVLLFGLLSSCTGFLAGSFSRFGDMAPQGKNTEQMREALGHMGTIYLAIGIQGIILTAMSSLLLAIGVGQVRYRRWAGAWSVYWGGLALVALAGMVAMSFFLIGPAYQKFFESIARASPTGALPSGLTGSMSTIFGGSSSVMTIFFYAPYPILLLIYFTREHVRAAMNR